MNLLPKPSESQPTNTNPESSGDALSSLDLSFLTGEIKKKLESATSQNGDDCMVDITNDHLCIATNNITETTEIVTNKTDKTKEDQVEEMASVHNCTKAEIKPMNDINVKLESIKPSSVPPLTVLDEKNGISVTLHFAKDKPREDIQVIVVTTISKNSLPLSNYLFQGVVPKASITIYFVFTFLVYIYIVKRRNYKYRKIS